MLLLTALHDPQSHSSTLHLGTMGLVWKDSQPVELWNVVEKVYKGEVWLGRTLIVSVLSMMTRRDEPHATDPEKDRRFLL